MTDEHWLINTEASPIKMMPARMSLPGRPIRIRFEFGYRSHSSVLAWRIPGTREPGGLPSMGSHRVGHDWSDLAVAAVRGASLVAETVKNLPAMQETWVWSLGREGPLGKSMATHSSIPPWRISWTEEPGELQSTGSQRVRHLWATKQT